MCSSAQEEELALKTKGLQGGGYREGVRREQGRRRGLRGEGR